MTEIIQINILSLPGLVLKRSCLYTNNIDNWVTCCSLQDVIRDTKLTSGPRTFRATENRGLNAITLGTMTCTSGM